MPQSPTGPHTVWVTGAPSYEQLQRAVLELHAACGVLFTALSPLSSPRPLINAGGTAMYAVTAEERMAAHAARVEALRRVTSVGLRPPLGPVQTAAPIAPPRLTPPTIALFPRPLPRGPHY